jgi:hypothetical protein
MDQGSGSSMSYAMTDMGNHLYIGGHTDGELIIIGGVHDKDLPRR